MAHKIGSILANGNPAHRLMQQNKRARCDLVEIIDLTNNPATNNNGYDAILQNKRARCVLLQTMEATTVEEKSEVPLILHALEHQVLGPAAAAAAAEEGKFSQNYSIIIHLLHFIFCCCCIFGFLSFADEAREEEIPDWAFALTHAFDRGFANIFDGFSRIKNSSAIRPYDVIEPVRNEALNFPPWFPATRQELYDATDQRVAELLKFYGLPEKPPRGRGSIRFRRIGSIARIIGVHHIVNPRE